MSAFRGRTNKFAALVSEVIHSIVMPPKATTGRGIAILVAAVLCFMGLSIGLIYLFPNLEEFAQYGYLGVFLASLISSATVIVPAPGVAAIMAAATIWNPALVAVVASVGVSSFCRGDVSQGRLPSGIITRQYQAGYEKAEDWMKRYGGLSIFVFALVPVFIFDLLGIAAGVLGFPINRFLLFCWAGRLPRCLIEAYVGLGMFHLITPFFFP